MPFKLLKSDVSFLWGFNSFQFGQLFLDFYRLTIELNLLEPQSKKAFLMLGRLFPLAVAGRTKNDDAAACQWKGEPLSYKL